MTEYRIENDRLRLTVDSRGAEMKSIFGLPDKTEFLWQGDPKSWPGRAPILFPIVGRVKDGVYAHEGRICQIDSPHGFAKSSSFEAECRGTDRVRFTLRSSAETRKQFPFDFVLRAEYSLAGSTLRLRFRVENTGTEPMPYSLGGHPGFNVPLGEGERFEDYRLEFEAEEDPERVLLDGVFLSGRQVPFPLKDRRVIPLSWRLFDDDAIILDKIRRHAVSLIGPGDRRYWTFSFDDFQYLGIWQLPRSNASFVSLEPWNGLPDSNSPGISELSRKAGIRILPPRAAAEASFQVEFER